MANVQRPPMANAQKPPAPAKEQQRSVRLFVGGVPSSTTPAEMHQIFDKYGEVTDLYLNAPKNFAFVKYAPSGAEKAQVEVHGMMFKGKPLNVHNAASQSALFVGDLPRFVTNKMLWEAFAPFGDLERAAVARDDKDMSLRWGVVEFKNKAKLTHVLARFEQGAMLIMGRTPCPVRVEPFRTGDTTVGVRRLPEYMNKEYGPEMSVAPRMITQQNGMEFELAAKWRALRQDQLRRKRELAEQLAAEQSALMSEISQRMEEERLQQEAMAQMQRQEELIQMQEREMLLRREAEEMRLRREAAMQQMQQMMMAQNMGARPMANGMGPSMMAGGQAPMQMPAMGAMPMQPQFTMAQGMVPPQMGVPGMPPQMPAQPMPGQPMPPQQMGPQQMQMMMPPQQQQGFGPNGHANFSAGPAQRPPSQQQMPVPPAQHMMGAPPQMAPFMYQQRGGGPPSQKRPRMG